MTKFVLRSISAVVVLLGFTSRAHADDDFTGWPYNVEGQQCVQFDGTILPEGTWRLVWPDELIGPGGFVIPEEATGTLLIGTPFPCAPRVTAPPGLIATSNPSEDLVLPATGASAGLVIVASVVLLCGLAIVMLVRHPRYQRGGSIPADELRRFVVEERGPEVFVPDVSPSD